MKRTKLYTPLLGTLLLAGCVVSPAYGPDYGVAPALPITVDLDVEPYFYGGFYYYYHQNDHHWTYAHDRAGPWRELPKDRYPREIRFKDHEQYRDRNRERERDRHD